jgi:hypothetical protein
MTSELTNTSQTSDLPGIYLAALDNSTRYELNIGLLLGNFSESPREVLLSLTAFSGDSDGVLVLGGTGYQQIFLPPRDFVAIDKLTDEGQLDFATTYTIKAEDSYFMQQVGYYQLQRRNWVSIPFFCRDGYLSGFSKVGPHVNADYVAAQ